MVIELCISLGLKSYYSCDFEIMCMIYDQIAQHSVPLLNYSIKLTIRGDITNSIHERVQINCLAL